MTFTVIAERERDRRLLRRAGALFALICLLYLVGLAFDALNADNWPDMVRQLLYHALTFSFPLVGVLIARRQPRNAITWILLSIGLAWAVSAATEGYWNYGLITHPGSLPIAEAMVAVSSWLWVPALVPAATLLLLLFPDGHLPSPRWRWVVWLSVVAMAAVSLSIFLGPATLVEEGFPKLDNPLSVSWFEPALSALQVFLIAIPVCMIASAAALVIRFRRSRGVERLQLKWLSAAAAVVAVTYAVALLVSLGQSWTQADTPFWASVIQTVAVATFALIPVSIGIAILRYRLYDIDRLISRSIVYFLLTAVLISVYAAIVVGIGAATGRSDSPVVIAAATLLVAALFGPARRRIQAVIDRRLYRRRYDAEKVTAAFAARLRDELDLDALSGELRLAATQAVQPESVGVWIRTRGVAP